MREEDFTAERDHDHADERGLLMSFAARIFEPVKVSHDFVERDVNRGHEQPPRDPGVETRRSKLQALRAWRNSSQIARTAQNARWLCSFEDSAPATQQPHSMLPQFSVTTQEVGVYQVK